MATINAKRVRAGDLPADAMVLAPADAESEATLAKSRPRGDGVYRIEYAQPRNGKMHRLYWAVLGDIAKALNAGPGADVWTAQFVHDWVRLETGQVAVIAADASQTAALKAMAETRGGVLFKPKSVAFNAMDQDEFNAFFQAMTMAVERRLLPHVSVEQMRWNIESRLFGAPLIKEVPL